jgi:hypothetical protein
MIGVMGFPEILMLAILSGGSSSTDVIALVQPTHYFQHRGWEASVDKMTDLAGEDPKDARGQIAQLSCLRYLADESAALKKSPRYPDHRRLLEAIAKGTKAQDPQGFAQDYAKRVLRMLDNTKLEAVKLRPLRADALNWFPANATIAGAIDLQLARQLDTAKDPFKDLIKLMPDRVKKEMYTHIEKCGNIRIERVAFAYTEGTGKRDGKIFMRVTGKGNHDWMVEAMQIVDRGRMETKKTKDENGTPITLMQDANRPPVFMLVGDTDFLIVGFQDDRAKHADLVAEVLEARSKKKPNAASGALKERLAKVPDKAVGFVVGNVPDEMKRELAREFNPIPANVIAFMERAQQGLDLHVETTLPNAEDAGKLVQKIGDLRKQGTKALEDEMQRPRRPGEPPIPFQAMINLLASLQVQNKGDNVQVRAFVSDGLIQQLASGLMLLGGGRGIPPCGEPD